MANKKVLHKRSSVINTDGSPKQPTEEQLDYGELAINYAAGVETLFVKNSDNDIVSFATEDKLKGYIDDKVDDIDYDLSAYLTKVAAAETYQPIGDYQDALKCYQEDYVSNGNSSVTLLNTLRIGTTSSDGASILSINSLGSVRELKQLETLGTLDYLGTLRTLDYLQTLQTLEELGTLGTLDYLQTLQTLEELGTLCHIGTNSPAPARVFSLVMEITELSTLGIVYMARDHNTVLVRDFLQNGIAEGDLVYGRTSSTSSTIELYIGTAKVDDDPYMYFSQMKENITK